MEAKINYFNSNIMHVEKIIGQAGTFSLTLFNQKRSIEIENKI